MEARSHFDLSTIQRSYPHFTGGNPERSDSFPKATQLGSSRARTRTESLERVSQERAPPKAARPDRRTPHCQFCRRNGLRFTLGENTGPCGVTPSLSFPVCPKGPLSKTEPHPHSLLPRTSAPALQLHHHLRFHPSAPPSFSTSLTFRKINLFVKEVCTELLLCTRLHEYSREQKEASTLSSVQSKPYS